MDDIFGIPIAGMMAVLLGALALCLLSIVWGAWRRPVIFKLGVRNIPRRKAETVLIGIGRTIAALLMTWIPSRLASRIAPAEALRYE